MSALAISAGGFFMNYQSFQQRTLPPEIFTKINNFQLHSDPLTAVAEIDFSVSNRSSNSTHIVACSVTTDGLNGGGGGYGEQLKPCNFEPNSSSTSLPFEIQSGQTQFFTITHIQDLTSYDGNGELALKLMGIDLNEIVESLAEGSCTTSFSVSFRSRAFGQNCPLVESDTTQEAFTLLLQTGDGQIVEKPIYLTLNQSWPWNRY